MHGSGFIAGQSVVLYSNSALLPETQTPLAVQASGTFDVNVTLTIKANEPDINAYYVGATPDLGAPSIASTAVQVPCQPTVSVTQDCGDPGVPIVADVVLTGFELASRSR